jgi:16S rRNA (uracil1498-N3)-methyltransferase
MRFTRIFTPQTLSTDTALELEPEPSRHIARVLRMVVGNTLTLFNGSGGEYTAVITQVSKHAVTVQTGAHLPGLAESPLEIHLGIGLSRGERMDWVMQKATELGVTCITPLRTEHCAVKLSAERGEKKLRHWQQVVTSACEQSGRCRIPNVEAIVSLTEWVQASQAERRLILDPGADDSDTGPAPRSVALLVGPEGGFSSTEIAAAGAAGFTALRLGPRILRTETAPLAAIALVQGRWGDMQPGA